MRFDTVIEFQLKFQGMWKYGFFKKKKIWGFFLVDVGNVCV
jgi:hypothetical protein